MAVLTRKASPADTGGARRDSGRASRRIRQRWRPGLVGDLFNWILLVVAYATACGPWTIYGQGLEAEEYQIKAAFLFNFAKFIEWPAEAFPDARAPLILGIIGTDPFGDALERIATTKTLGDRRLVIKRFKPSEKPKACHILFISVSEKKRLTEILESLKGSTVLTVSDIAQFAESGGMIHFIMEGDKVRFEINLDVVEHARLLISAKLLHLAKAVRKNGRNT